MPLKAVAELGRPIFTAVLAWHLPLHKAPRIQTEMFITINSSPSIMPPKFSWIQSFGKDAYQPHCY